MRINLRWENVNLSQSVLAIKNTKTERDRFIPLTPVAQGVLTKLSQHQVSKFSFAG
jgi:site-specific recombinase XerD